MDMVGLYFVKPSSLTSDDRRQISRGAAKMNMTRARVIRVGVKTKGSHFPMTCYAAGIKGRTILSGNFVLLLKSFYELSSDSRNGGANRTTLAQHTSVLSANTSAYGNVAQRNNEF